MELITFYPSNVGDQDDNKNSAESKQFCEVQAIILAHYSTYDIHPLLQKDSTGKEKPKFLLPFANEAIITYPLRLLEIHGFTDILVVVTDDFAEDMVNFLASYKYYGGIRPNITPLTVNEEDLGEIQVLKQIHQHIKTDFLVIRCDIFTNAPLCQLLRLHRRENASITLLLSKETKTKQHKKTKKTKKTKNTHIIGTDRKYHRELVLKGHPKEIERLWYMKARADLEDDDTAFDKGKHDEAQLVLNKGLLDCISHLRLTTKLKVQQIGIFCRWILLWILEEAPKEFELLYEEAVPYLIDLQTEIKEVSDTQSVITNDSNKCFDFPDLMRRSSNINDNINKEECAPNKLLKQASHYASGLFLSHGDVLGNDYMKRYKLECDTKSDTPRNKSSPFIKKQLSTVDDLPQYLSADAQDKLKIFGYIYCEENDNGFFCCIINNSSCLLSLSLSLIHSIIKFEEKLKPKQSSKSKKFKQNRQNPLRKNEEREQYFALKEFEHNCLLHLILSLNAINECQKENESANIKNGCIISPNCIIGNKTRIDKCILQPFVNIGKNCKIINCVIFGHVTIGDNCKISNTIISTYTNIADCCNIHNCKIADSVNIKNKSNLKNETLQYGAINDDENIINVD